MSSSVGRTVRFPDRVAEPSACPELICPTSNRSDACAARRSLFFWRRAPPIICALPTSTSTLYFSSCPPPPFANSHGHLGCSTTPRHCYTNSPPPKPYEDVGFENPWPPLDNNRFTFAFPKLTTDRHRLSFPTLHHARSSDTTPGIGFLCFLRTRTPAFPIPRAILRYPT